MQNFFDEPSQDLLENGFTINENFPHSLSLATLKIKNENEAEKLKKEIGDYAILTSPFFNTSDFECEHLTKKIFKKIFKKFVGKKKKKILVVGLGNQRVDADSFGALCVDNITLKNNIFAIKPDVLENTNLMSFDVVDGVCKVLKPELVILIDSLGTYNIKRLACSFQLSNVGILPGGAIHNRNKSISKKSLGIPCVVIGVPLMVFAKGLNNELNDLYGNLILTPKNIEEMVHRCSFLVCEAINEIC